MKEATGEVSMTVITIVAVAVIAGLLALLWPKISGMFDRVGSTEQQCQAQGGTWDSATGACNLH